MNAHSDRPETTGAGHGKDSGPLRSLRGVDPFTDTFADTFAIPGPDRASRLGDERPRVAPAPPPSDDPGAMYPCQCACSCANDSTVPAAMVISLEAATFIRCNECFTAGHATTSISTRPLRPGQEVHRGQQTGAPVVVTKVAVDPEDEAHDAAIREEIRRQQWDQATQAWLDQVPERFRKPLDEALPPQIEEVLGRLASANGTHHTSLISLGPFGSGKTWLAYVLARQAVERRLIWPAKIKIFKERSLLEPLVTGDQWDRHKLLDRLLDARRLGMLVIDDVGTFAGGKPEDRVSVYTEIVDWFYARHMPLVMTSNLTLGEGDTLWAAIGGAAYDRMRAMTGPHGVVWRDDRRRAEFSAQWEREYQASLGNNGMA